VRPGLAGVRVLVVDDHDVNRRMLEDMVVKWEMLPTLAESAASGFAAMHQARDDGHPFALALIDVHMPDADGFSLEQQIQADPTLASATILMLSSDRNAGHAARCRTTGSGYVTKPVTQSDLLTAVTTVLGQAVSVDPLPLAARPAAGRTHHILLAEDNVINQRLAVRLLEKRGCTVVTARNGVEAVAAFAKDTFDVVLMDVQMPDMDGIEATAILREREGTTGLHVPIIAMTASAMKGDRERCLAAGMDEYIAKPIKPALLYALLDEIGVAPAIAAPAAMAPAPVPAIDSAALLDLVEADVEVMHEILQVYRETSGGLVHEVRVALEHGDSRALQQAAHSIKGSTGVIVARVASALAERLETMGRESDLANSSEVFAEFEVEMARVDVAVATLL
jgi:two-component system, sensor histidine kinase and response regulator